MRARVNSSPKAERKDAVKFVEAPRLARLAFQSRGGHVRRKATIARNREIFAQYQAGQTTAQLAQTYGLNRHTVVAIIGLERHRLEVSNDAFYEGQRLTLGVQAWVKS